jgi:biopolymer transport protein ExbD
MLRAAGFVLLMVLSDADARAACHVRLLVHEDGSVEMNGKRYVDPRQLKLRLGEYKEQGSHCQVTLRSDGSINFEAVGRILAVLQELGDMQIGFAAGPSGDTRN